MNFKKRNPKKISLLFILSTLFLLMLVLQQSCKKTDNDIKASTDQTMKFFKLPVAAPNVVKRIAAELEKQNSNKEFVAQFIKQEGVPRWDKASVGTANNLYITTNRSLSDGGTKKTDTTVIVPIVLEKDDHVSAFFMATVNDAVSISLLRNSDYKRFPYETTRPATSTTAEEFALRMMFLDRDVFGYTRFDIKDKMLFGIIKPGADTSKIKRTVDIGNNTNTPVTNLMQLCVTIETTTTEQICNTPWAAVCQPTCDNCGYPTCYRTTTTNSTTYCTPIGGTTPSWPTFPQTPGPTGGGGSPTGGGGTPCPLPVPFTASIIPASCQGQVPNPWPPQPCNCNMSAGEAQAALDAITVEPINGQGQVFSGSESAPDANGIIRKPVTREGGGARVKLLINIYLTYKSKFTGVVYKNSPNGAWKWESFAYNSFQLTDGTIPPCFSVTASAVVSTAISSDKITASAAGNCTIISSIPCLGGVASSYSEPFSSTHYSYE